MSFLLSDDELEFKAALRGLFERILPEDQLHNSLEEQPQFNLKLWKETREFGFEEYFDSGQGISLQSALGIVAVEVGRSLLPLPLIGTLFFNHYLLPKLKLIKLDRLNCNFAVLANNMMVVDNCFRELPSIFVTQSESALQCSFYEANSLQLFDTADLLFPKGNLLSAKPKWSKAEKDLDFNDFQDVENLLRAAQMFGAVQKVFELSKNYCAMRKQFSVSIDSFQVVQHKLVDIYLVLEALESLLSFAVWAWEDDRQQFPLASRAALRYASDNLPGVCEVALQLHGGIGFTWEYNLHLYLRRVQVLSLMSVSVNDLWGVV